MISKSMETIFHLSIHNVPNKYRNIVKKEIKRVFHTRNTELLKCFQMHLYSKQIFFFLNCTNFKLIICLDCIHLKLTCPT